MMSTGDKMTLLAEIIRVSIRGATEGQISDELSLAASQAGTYIRFLKARKLLVLVDDGDYSPSERGLAFLATYDAAADLVDIEESRSEESAKRPGANKGVCWDRSELAARMRDIIDK